MNNGQEINPLQEHDQENQNPIPNGILLPLQNLHEDANVNGLANGFVNGILPQQHNQQENGNADGILPPPPQNQHENGILPQPQNQQAEPHDVAPPILQNMGDWTDEEIDWFFIGLTLEGHGEWDLIATRWVRTRSAAQVIEFANNMQLL